MALFHFHPHYFTELHFWKRHKSWNKFNTHYFPITSKWRLTPNTDSWGTVVITLCHLVRDRDGRIEPWGHTRVRGNLYFLHDSCLCATAVSAQGRDVWLSPQHKSRKSVISYLFSSRRVVKVSVSTCYHETLDKRTLLLLTGEEIMQIQHWTGSKTDGISM